MICDFLIIIFLIFFGYIIYNKLKKFVIFKFINMRHNKTHIYKYTNNEICYNYLEKGNWYGLKKNSCNGKSFDSVIAKYSREYPKKCKGYYCESCYNNYYKNNDKPIIDNVYKRVIIPKNENVKYYILPLIKHKKIFNVKFDPIFNYMKIYNKNGKFLINSPILDQKDIMKTPNWIFSKNGFSRK